MYVFSYVVCIDQPVPREPRDTDTGPGPAPLYIATSEPVPHGVMAPTAFNAHPSFLLQVVRSGDGNA